jgi:hypothetical protein
MITLVTGIWDIKRDTLNDGWSRTFDHYIQRFVELLETDCNLIIFGDENLKEIVFKYRNEENTQFILRDIDFFKNNVFYDKIQSIRNDENWKNLASWLENSTQGSLELYNPLVMSKVFMLNDAKILSKFNDELIFWVDGGISNTVSIDYFKKDNLIKIKNYINKLMFITFPYTPNNEIHGFEINAMDNICNTSVNKVARGGFFGGYSDYISTFNSLYYQTLFDSLNQRLMGTEESIFTILLYNNPELFIDYSVEENGLIYLFFEKLKNKKIINKIKRDNIALYVLSYNSPKQFRTLMESFKLYDNNFIDKPNKFLLNNSTDLSTNDEYVELCDEYNFNQIKKDNIGICGGRQFIAEHAYENEFDYYYFFEDDMFLYKNYGVCKKGFPRFFNDLYNTSLNIIKKEKYDFLKLSFSEFYGDNSIQWAWYNVPQNIRELYWENNKYLDNNGVRNKPPHTNFNNIKSYNKLGYIDGEIYYSNWPQIVSKEGNHKMFIETKFNHPFEQTWMSHFYQLTKKNLLHSSVLLLSPIEHNRFEFYEKESRKEN